MGNSSPCKGWREQRSKSSSGTVLAQPSERRGEPACGGGEGSCTPAVHSLHRPGQKYISSLRQADLGNSILQANSPHICLSLLCTLIFGSGQKPPRFSKRQSKVNFQQAACASPSCPAGSGCPINGWGYPPSHGTFPKADAGLLLLQSDHLEQ